MKLIETKIDGLVLLEPTIIRDNRGYFTESFNQNEINNLFGELNFVQDNESMSSKGVLRGLHFQNPPYAQAKLIRCIKGTVLDIALDIRNNSKTYGKFVTTIISEENKLQLFIPKGFAHGFIVLSDSAKLSYKVDNYYNSESENGVIWNDSDLRIDWKVNQDEIIVSKKDAKLSTFSSLISPF